MIERSDYVYKAGRARVTERERDAKESLNGTPVIRLWRLATHALHCKRLLHSRFFFDICNSRMCAFTYANPLC